MNSMSTKCVVLLLTAVAALAGCEGSTTPSGTATSKPEDAAQRELVGKTLLDGAVDMLNRTDAFDERQTDVTIEHIVRQLNESLVMLGATKEGERFTVDDGKVLREIVWIRDAARLAVGPTTDSLERATRMFDWTVRNIQLVPDDAPPETAPPQLPWHTLLLGRGTALEQAWLFQLMARQQGLNVVLLAYPGSTIDAKPHWWCAALLLDGELYLFDVRIGLPIPVPGGAKVATLKQVAADDKLLRALDLPGGEPYPVKAADVAQMIALCETSSVYQSPLFATLQRELANVEPLVLAANVPELLASAGKSPHIVKAQPWPMRDLRYAATRDPAVYKQLDQLIRPFRLPEREMLREGTRVAPPLWTARIRHFSGKFQDSSGNSTWGKLYQEARPAEEDLAQVKVHFETWEGLLRMKQHATYWLGVAALEQGSYEAAENYFQLVLKDDVNGGWTVGARYNCGRAFEADGKPAEAIAMYRSSPLGVPPDLRALYRARRLEGTAVAKSVPPTPAATPTATATAKPAPSATPAPAATPNPSATAPRPTATASPTPSATPRPTASPTAGKP